VDDAGGMKLDMDTDVKVIDTNNDGLISELDDGARLVNATLESITQKSFQISVQTGGAAGPLPCSASGPSTKAC
jgi:hypothetical protein